MRKKIIAIGCMMALTAAMVTGCAGTSGSSSNSSTKAATEQNTDGNDKMQGRPQDDNSKMVKVTKVDGSTITAAVGENPGGPGGKVARTVMDRMDRRRRIKRMIRDRRGRWSLRQPMKP